MRSTAALASGREAYARFDWSQAYESLLAADRDDDLPPDDVQRLAVAATLTGHDDEATDAWERAHRAFVEIGEIGPAVRCAFWLGMQHMRLGRHAPGAGWMGRGQRLLNDSQVESVERGYLQIPGALRALSEGTSGAPSMRSAACWISRTVSTTPTSWPSRNWGGARRWRRWERRPRPRRCSTRPWSR